MIDDDMAKSISYEVYKDDAIIFCMKMNGGYPKNENPYFFIKE